MKNKIRKYGSLAAALLLIVCMMTGCGGADREASQKQEIVQAAQEEAQKEEKETASDETQENAETQEQDSEEEEYLDVESVEDGDVDYSKYEEKKTTSSQGSTTEGVTYSDGQSQGQDEYQTDPVPEGMQNPVEPGDIEINQEKEYTCYFSISCSTILNNMGDLTEGKEGLVPSDGQIYAQREVSFYEGESVFDILQRETKNNRIHMEYSFFPGFNSNYIEGINNLYEFDCGSNSGWMYCVNGWYPNYGCSRYVVQDGDVIEWNYTCDLGRDLGRDVDWSSQNGAR